MAGNLVQDPKTEKCSYFVLKTVEAGIFYCHIWPFSRFFWRWVPVFLVQILCEILPLLELAPVRTSPAVPYSVHVYVSIKRQHATFFGKMLDSSNIQMCSKHPITRLRCYILKEQLGELSQKYIEIEHVTCTWSWHILNTRYSVYSGTIYYPHTPSLV